MWCGYTERLPYVRLIVIYMTYKKKKLKMVDFILVNR
jgi:hypothetical protein